MKIRAVIFDIGGVLIERVNRARAKAFDKATGIKGSYKKTKDLRRKFSKGQLTTKEFIEQASRKMGISQKKFLDIWKKTTRQRKIRKSVLQLAEKIKKKGFIVGLISNTNPIDSTIFKKTLYNLFYPNIFESHKLGYRKPEKEIYEIALKKLKVKPSETVFIDDRIKNVVGARKLGIKAIHFESYKKLIKDLKKLGIIGRR